jgi:sulfate permease, SulP family
MPFIDVTAASMLAELFDDLRRGGIQLVLARDIGQVRDFLRQTGEPTAPAYPSVEAAVDALRRDG